MPVDTGGQVNSGDGLLRSDGQFDVANPIADCFEVFRLESVQLERQQDRLHVALRSLSAIRRLLLPEISPGARLEVAQDMPFSSVGSFRQHQHAG